MCVSTVLCVKRRFVSVTATSARGLAFEINVLEELTVVTREAIEGEGLQTNMHNAGRNLAGLKKRTRSGMFQELMRSITQYRYVRITFIYPTVVPVVVARGIQRHCSSKRHGAHQTENRHF